jgi:hypothetical protein
MQGIRVAGRFSVCFVLAIACLAPGLGLADDSSSEVSLRWALGAWTGDSDSPDAIQRDTRLEAGTRLKFLVEPTSPSTVYLVMQDTEKAIHVLYRDTPRFEENGTAKPTYIPPGSQYFELDDAAGLDTFFLLASAEPLTDLESLLDRYDAAAAPDKGDLGSQIVKEIRRQHKAHRNFSRPVEKPVMIGGQTRGDESPEEAVDRLAIDVSAVGFYAKTITIDH